MRPTAMIPALLLMNVGVCVKRLPVQFVARPQVIHFGEKAVERLRSSMRVVIK
jgi:hypothetical protein